jgi:hypothetical protein
MNPRTHVRRFRNAAEPSGRRRGLAALEVVMIIGAMMPIAVLLFMLLRHAMMLYHSLIGNTVGSPLL